MKDRIFGALTLGLAAALLVAGLSSFGIWDPWELEAADVARRIAEGHASGSTEVTPWLVSLGFRAFGVHEWAGRLPLALTGLLTVALALALVTRFADARAGVYAALITATSPLFLFNARTMLGEAPSFALQAAIALAGLAALATPRGTSRANLGSRMALLGIWLGLIAGAILARGALLGALPPVAALAVASFVSTDASARDARSSPRVAVWFVWAIAIALVAAIGADVIADRAGYSPWLGGRPQAGVPPRFDTVIERVFHAFAPWSALLPLALARMAMTPPRTEPLVAHSDEHRLRLFVLVWAVAGYGAQTLYLSRYGTDVTYLPVVALAAAVALFLRDVERSTESAWPMAIGATLLAGLLLRDYALYPEGPVEGLSVHEISLPKVVNPKAAWAALLGAFAVATLLALGSAGHAATTLAAPYRWLAVQWRRGFAFRAWLGCAGLVLAALLALGIIAWITPSTLHLSTQGARWAKALLWAPLVLPIALAGAEFALRWHGRLRGARMLGVLVAGAAVGAYAVFGFMSELSAHFSPREIYETYNRLAGPSEALAEYKVGGRAAMYYARGDVREVSSQSELIDHLANERRRWAAFPADALAEIDRAFRRRTTRHLFVADARSARVVLATNQPIAGRDNESFLVTSVLSEPPAIQHRVRARFDKHIEFLGYDLALPHKDHVGAGESFDVTWYFRCLKPVAGDYKVFVHIDAEGQRIHGDHEPVDGKYPVKLWDTGDVIVDRQRLDVPATYRAGDYAIYLGFYAGEHRLPVEEGPKDDVNRVRAGVLRIQ